MDTLTPLSGNANSYIPVTGNYTERFKLLSVVQKLVPFSDPVHKCHRVPFGSFVNVHRQSEYKRAHFGAVKKCRHVWDCPVCSRVIMSGRSKELSDAIKEHRKTGGELFLITLTARHNLSMALAPLMINLTTSWNRLSINGSFRRYFKKYTVGFVRNFEITFGDYGWHPHFHILAFVKAGVSMDEFKSRCDTAWLKALKHVGLSGVSGVACDVRDGRAAAEYVTKLVGELALSNVKDTREGSYTPFQIASLASEYNWAKYRWKEYREAVKGRRTLVWSQGLKDLFKIDELSDNELMDKVKLDFTAPIPTEEFLRLSMPGRGQVLSIMSESSSPEHFYTLYTFYYSQLDSICRADRIIDPISIFNRKMREGSG